MRIKAHILYIFIAVGISILTVYFLFGATGIFMHDKKLAELGNIENSVVLLRAEVAEMEKQSHRLKTDSEYVISIAKSFGYLEEKEKVVRIVGRNNNGAYSYYTDSISHSTLLDNESGEHFQSNFGVSSARGFLPILLI